MERYLGEAIDENINEEHDHVHTPSFSSVFVIAKMKRISTIKVFVENDKKLQKYFKITAFGNDTMLT